MLLGPSGSGKTTCYSVLAATLSHLAATGNPDGLQNDSMIKGENPQMSASGWASVDTLVIFPNTMTHNEIFGCFCERSGWKDGVIAKVLRDLDHSKLTNTADAKNLNQTLVVLDGNPVGQPGWLDYYGEDLFNSTLSLIRANNLTSAISNERDSSGNLSYGLQEVMSFVRILRALLQPLEKSLMISKIKRGIIIITFDLVNTLTV